MFNHDLGFDFATTWWEIWNNPTLSDRIYSAYWFVIMGIFEYWWPSVLIYTIIVVKLVREYDKKRVYRVRMGLGD